MPKLASRAVTSDARASSLASALAEQLSALPLLTTVLRVDFDLYEATTAFEQAASVLEAWANAKCRPFGATISNENAELSFSAERFALEYARTADAWALSLEHPDSSPKATKRSWICEIALERRNGGTRFSTRLSYRQPMNGLIPEPRAPKYLAEIVRNVGAVDHQILEGRPQKISAGSLSALTDLLESKSRRLPVIAISNDEASGEPFCPPQQLADFHCGTAHIVQLDVRATWGLSTLWGDRWSTYHGAVRCYAPGLDHKTGDPFQHRLWLPQFIQRADANHANGFLDLSLRHVFATVTAQFESFPLLSPSAIRRHVAEVAASQKATAASERAKEATSAVQVIPEPIWIDTLPVEPTSAVETDSTANARELEQAAAIEKEYSEKIDILTTQLKALEGQLQEARNQNAQERVKYENLQDELDLYKQLYSELELREAVLTGKKTQENSEIVRAMWTSFSGFFQSIQNLSAQYKRVESEVTDKEQIEQDLEYAKADNHSLRAQIEVLKLRSNEISMTKAELRLNDPDSLREFLDDHPHGTIVLMSSAEKAYRDYPFNNLERMVEGLTILRDCYLPMKLASGEEQSRLHEEFQRRVESGRFKFGLSAKEANRKHHEEDHTVVLPNGCRIPCEKLRDKTTNMNWQFFFGVYFAWDESDKTLYIKGFGHGESPSAHT